ncbi:zinc ribbon domain-containing protein [Halovenus salina]|uniref:Zinc ribbon domain-containing protein n=1 Tax=Halovenus salina TaxID=1510225 RepID=A0ABD5VVR0_9EURY|nr:zinc ribbon domain-containing protein [Halovenus salina]
MSDSTHETHAQKRPWLALLLTILVPGLGHAYLRLWLRSLLWLALYLTATTFVLPDGATPEELSVDAFVAASEAVPIEAALVVLGVSVLCLVDVYMMTGQINNRIRHANGELTACPNCGKEIDDDLSFCHWCTTEIDESEA